MRYAAAAFALFVAATPACAQNHNHDHGAAGAAAAVTAEPKPEGWQVRLDRPDRGSVDDVAFTEMAPGWHITTGPAAVLYRPEAVASGDYHLESTIHLFDPGERNEGYGVFFGGSDLDGPDQLYTYFLLRQDGRFLIKVRDADGTAVVRDWTAHPAIRGWASRAAGEASVANTLVVHVQGNDVLFIVNGAVVAQMPRSELPATEGTYGLRVNHSINLHVATLIANDL